MKYSYHTHTARCHHARGTEEEYILKAITEDVKVLGFSDHAPMPYRDGYISHYKMLPEEISDYFSVLLSLKEKYADKIEIKIGFETEYYAYMWQDCLEFWKPYPVDYLILGQHFAPDERGAYVARPATTDITLLKDYTDATIAGMNTGIITYVAHPDIINFVGSESVFLSEMERIIKEAVRLDMPIEYNLLGKTLDRNYPTDSFWRLASDFPVRVILGCDSHAPKRVVDREEVEAAEKYLATLGIKPIDEVELKKVLI